VGVGDYGTPDLLSLREKVELHSCTLGTVIPVAHSLRVVRGALLKGLGFTDLWPGIAALGVFVLVVATISMLRDRMTLD
jgi:hypothetical protein